MNPILKYPSNRFIGILIMVLLISSCKKKEDEQPAPVITEVTADKTQDKVLPLDTVYFKVTTNIPATIDWDFGDGTSHASGESVMHVFTQIKYYRVSVSAAANNKTAIGTVDVNTTVWKKCNLLKVVVKSIPSTNTLGGNWDTDATGPDLFAYPAITGYTNTLTPIAPNITAFTNLNIQLAFNPPDKVKTAIDSVSVISSSSKAILKSMPKSVN